eukprot:COSAG02_NODE_8405_length_2583_cov_13.092593_1_plen_266_part_01
MTFKKKGLTPMKKETLTPAKAAALKPHWLPRAIPWSLNEPDQRGMIVVGDRLLLKLDGATARVLRADNLRKLREIGEAGLYFRHAVALEAPLVVTSYRYSGTIDVWNCKNGTLISRLELEGGITHLQMAPDGSAAFAVGTGKGEVAFIGADGVLRGEIAKLEGEITQLQMTPDGSAAAVGTYKGEVAFIGADGVLRGEVAKLEGAIRLLQMAPDGSAAAVGTTEGEVAFIGADGVLRGEVAKLEGGITHLQMTPDGSAAAVGTDKG